MLCPRHRKSAHPLDCPSVKTAYDAFAAGIARPLCRTKQAVISSLIYLSPARASRNGRSETERSYNCCLPRTLGSICLRYKSTIYPYLYIGHTLPSQISPTLPPIHPSIVAVKNPRSDLQISSTLFLSLSLSKVPCQDPFSYLSPVTLRHCLVATRLSL